MNPLVALREKNIADMRQTALADTLSPTTDNTEDTTPDTLNTPHATSMATSAKKSSSGKQSPTPPQAPTMPKEPRKSVSPKNAPSVMESLQKRARKVSVAFAISPDTVERLANYCESEGMIKARVVDEAIASWLTKAGY